MVANAPGLLQRAELGPGAKEIWPVRDTRVPLRESIA
jgi:hypothetical protein